MRFNRLSYQILAVFTVVIVVCLGASGWLVLQISEDIITSKISEGDRHLARRIAQEVEAEIASVKPVVTLLAESQGLRLMEATEVKREIDRTQRSFPEIISMYVADVEGEQIARTGTDELENVSNVWSFQVAKEGEELVSDIYPAPVTSEPMQSIALPVIDNGTVVGVVSADVSFRRVMLSVMGIDVGKNGSVAVVAGNGRVVAHTFMEQLPELDLSKLPAVEAVLAGQEGARQGYTDELGRQVLGSYSPIEELGWGVLIQKPLADIDAEVGQLRTTILWTTIGAVLLAVLAGGLMSRQITKPIRQLASASERIAQGDLSTPVEVKSSNEIGVLAYSFNQMMVSLKKSRDELEQRVVDLQRAEEALRESGERYRGLFDGVPVGIYRTTPDGRILDANPTLVEMLGYPDRESLLAVNVTGLYVNTEDRKRWQALIEREGIVRDFKLQLGRRDGTIIWVEDHGRAARDGDGGVLHYEGSLADVTERVQAEKALRRYTEQLEALRKASLHLTSSLALQPLLEAILEQTLQLVPADNTRIFLYAGERLTFGAVRWVNERKQRPYAEPRPNGLAYTVARSGERIAVPDMSTHPLYQDQPLEAAIIGLPLISGEQVRGVMNVAYDEPRAFDENEIRILELLADQAAVAIENAQLYEQVQRYTVELEQQVAERTAELRAANEKIRQRADELAALYDVSRDLAATLDLEVLLPAIAQRVTDGLGAARCAVFLFDERAGVLQARAAHGYMAERLADFSYRPGEEVVGQAYATGGPQYVPDLNLVPDLPQRDEIRAVLAVPLASPTAGLLGVLSVTSLRPDAFTPDQQQLLETMAGQIAGAIQNARLYEAAQEADRLKSAFLASMSHELRTPLNSIIGFAGILLQGLPGPLNAEQEKQLNMLYGSAKHLLALINDVLDISKIEAGQLEITRQPFDMRQAIEKVVRAVMPLAEKKELALVAEVAPEVGQITSDRRRVEQILINLVNNAIKFTEEGVVCVECEVNDSWLVTRVVDTGIGIKPEDVGKLFEAFRQVDTGLARVKEGTGLGLSICKKLLEMLGGEIWVESEWGVGSIFTFTLPEEIGE